MHRAQLSCALFVPTLFPDHFINILADSNTSKAAFNQYSVRVNETRARSNAVRRANLRRYLLDMQRIRPKIILIGEAPGYRGCRLTGIPFTSRAQVTQGIWLDDNDRIFGANGDYLDSGERLDFQRENSATMIWSVIKDHRPLPLLWNAYPFHPHRLNDPWSNRKPNRDELNQGLGFICMLLLEFQIERVVAVGNCAASSLRQLGIKVLKIRHPSFGGKGQFVEQLKEIQSA